MGLRHHARHHSQFVLLCEREQILGLLLPPCAGLGNILWYRCAKLSLVWISLLLLRGSGCAVLLGLTVMQIEQFVLYKPVQFPESPHRTASEQTLDLAGAIAKVALRRSAVRLRQNTACSVWVHVRIALRVRVF